MSREIPYISPRRNKALTHPRVLCSQEVFDLRDVIFRLLQQLVQHLA